MRSPRAYWIDSARLCPKHGVPHLITKLRMHEIQSSENFYSLSLRPAAVGSYADIVAIGVKSFEKRWVVGSPLTEQPLLKALTRRLGRRAVLAFVACQGRKKLFDLCNDWATCGTSRTNQPDGAASTSVNVLAPVYG